MIYSLYDGYESDAVNGVHFLSSALFDLGQTLQIVVHANDQSSELGLEVH